MEESHAHAYSSLDVPIFAKLYEFYKKLASATTTFPKTKRYTLGQKSDNLTLEVFELLFSVPNAKDKMKTLHQISGKIDLLKILLRLAKDTQALTNNNYLELQALLQEIGKMLGGWIKATKQSLLQKQP